MLKRRRKKSLDSNMHSTNPVWYHQKVKFTGARTSAELLSASDGGENIFSCALSLVNSVPNLEQQPPSIISIPPLSSSTNWYANAPIYISVQPLPDVLHSPDSKLLLV
mmetsp:Transcript_35802/g.56073  ORF Transcript_35802/g.56073 Transcript_35802/m.56073 type:complete len:108 (-) Transcript_35802:406-729(-)